MLHTKTFLLAAFIAFAAPAAARADDVIDYSKRDERMNAAMAKGQATLPDFDAALARHIDHALLNVRVPYGTSGNEYLWLTEVRRNPDGSYDGIVTGDVLHVPALHEGSPYHAARSGAVDWLYRDDKGDHGGWTVRVMRLDMTPEQRANDRMHFVD